jgi:hypothetical protein
MTDPIKLISKLPAGDGNGLVAILPELLTDEPQHFVVIALVDAKEVVLDKDSRTRTARVRLRRIEVVLRPDDQKVVRRIMERSLNQRMGTEQLPYDLELEITDAFVTDDEDHYREEPGTSGDPEAG